DVLNRYSVFECLYPSNQKEKIAALLHQPASGHQQLMETACEDWLFNLDMATTSLREHFRVHSLSGFGLEDKPLAISCAGALLEYLKRMNQQPLAHVDRLTLYLQDDYLYISPAACQGLELEQLAEVMDQTRTPMGRRLLRHWIFHPLKNRKDIEDRQRAIKILLKEETMRQELERLLSHAPDVEKSLSRLSCGTSSVKDILALKTLLSKTPAMVQVLKPFQEKESVLSLTDVPAVRELLENAIEAEVPLAQPEGKIIRKGFDEELDRWRNLQENGRQWLRDLQAREIQRTGIASLKVGYNQVFGYYLEVSKANLHLVPADYLRKQTLVNGERFITAELKEFEEKMVVAEEEVLRREKELLEDVTRTVLSHCQALHTWSNSLARLDVLLALSRLAQQPGYVCPEISEGKEIFIRDGRHPVVEHSCAEPFVPNDTLLDSEKNHLLIITGPNMAGKSTYIRQVALLTIMAQLGSYVPAAEMKVGLVDRIFTRIGARDEIARGQSTFMVEMTETASILNNLTERSLVVLDEIGRGTSTADGFSLAWAVAEHLAALKVRTLFATHLHELTALAGRFRGVKNYNVAVEEHGQEIVFLHKIRPGGSDESYGIYVAQLAGLPEKVITSARQLLQELEIKNVLKDKLMPSPVPAEENLFSQERNTLAEEMAREVELAREIMARIEDLNLDTITPLEALNLIHQIQEQLRSLRTIRRG
ncbi:MAG TPA: DNA mismatch repair protein MutS, partial [bacterium]|nr:DNA mismatch repair protein MutS [bacterium]